MPHKRNKNKKKAYVAPTTKNGQPTLEESSSSDSSSPPLSWQNSPGRTQTPSQSEGEAVEVGQVANVDDTLVEDQDETSTTSPVRQQSPTAASELLGQQSNLRSNNRGTLFCPSNFN